MHLFEIWLGPFQLYRIEEDSNLFKDENFKMTKTLFRLAETEKSSDKEELKVNYSSSKLEQLTELSPTLDHTDFNYTMACSPNVFIKEV